MLFADASRVNVRALRADAALPARLLGIGLPLTIGAGAAAAALLFDGSGLWVAAAIGAIVAPTDAALGASIMADERVPSGVRRLINVESGLNDGIATPFVNLFIAGRDRRGRQWHPPDHGRVDLLGGAGLGIGVGVLGAVLLALARRHGWSTPSFRPIAVLALALFAYSAPWSPAPTGSSPPSWPAWPSAPSTVAGEVDLRFTEESGTLLSLLVWFMFGAVMLARAWPTWAARCRVRPLGPHRPADGAGRPRARGSGLDRATVGFVGWFGPRGLASVVFGLIAVDSLAPASPRSCWAR